MAGWPSIHAVWFGGLAFAAQVGAQQAQPPRGAQVATPVAPLQRLAIPKVTGLQLDSAQRILALMKLIMRVDPKPDGSRPVARDTVIQQRPDAGQPIPSDRIVNVAVKLPPKIPTRGLDVAVPGLAAQQQLVPNVAGLALDSAGRVLTLRKLTMRVETRPRGLRPIAQDVVTQQSPLANKPVPTDRTVVVEVTIVMPNVIGQNVGQARDILASRGIKAGYATEERLGTPSDAIIRQDPQPGEPVRSSLTADLTGAIEVIRVPDVTGLTVPLARSRLARFVVREELAPNAAAPNTIFRQDPVRFTPARPGSTVTVYVAQAIQPIQRPVPNVVGTQVQDANVILAKSGFQTGRISDDDDANVAAGVVVTQNPAGGQQADTGTRVALTVRTNRVRVPGVLTLTESDAKQQIAARGLQVGTVEPRDDAAKPGTVIGQSPIAQTPVQRGSVVSLVVARQASQSMPNLVGLSRAAAASLVRQRGLILGLVDTSSTQVRPDTVVSQDPARDSPVRAGDRVRFTVGAEQKLVVVPDLVGRRVNEARRAIDSAGLQLGTLRGVADSSAGRVASQSPSPRRRVPPNERVDLDTTIARAIVSLVVTPERAELRSGDTVRFTAIATMNDGTRGRARAMWSARAGGTITSDGLFTAGADSGSYDVTATDFARVAAATARVRVTPAPPGPPSAPVVPDIVGLSLAQARAVASRAGFTLVVSAGQTPRGADTVIAQSPLARTRASSGSLLLMAQFSTATATRPLWILWLALGISVLAAAAKLLRRKPPTPAHVAPPPITYAAGAKPPSFSIDEGTSSRGLELSLSLKDDAGVQAVAETQSRAP